jgi:hypothetical protein
MNEVWKLRLICLELAIETNHEDTAVETVLKDAQQFYDFVCGTNALADQERDC